VHMGVLELFEADELQIAVGDLAALKGTLARQGAVSE
jgi:hypothetical protein